MDALGLRVLLVTVNDDVHAIVGFEPVALKKAWQWMRKFLQNCPRRSYWKSIALSVRRMTQAEVVGVAVLCVGEHRHLGLEVDVRSIQCEQLSQFHPGLDGEDYNVHYRMDLPPALREIQK